MSAGRQTGASGRNDASNSFNVCTKAAERMAWTSKAVFCATIVVVMMSSLSLSVPQPGHTSQSDACTEQKLAELQRSWTELMEHKSDEDKVYLATAVFDDIAKHSQYLSEQLQTLLLAEAHYDSTEAAVLFFDMWDTIITLYPDTEQLKAEVQHDAATATDLARVFYGNAPIIAKSIVNVFGQSLLTPSEKLAWSVCLGAIAETVQLIAAEVDVKAVCHVDEDSGLPEFPINGNVIFTQPLYGGLTTIHLSLCGFNDTTKHGWHVHEFGTTANQCLAAGAHFNPQNLQHGAPQEFYRHVGDLGNLQADKKGRVVLRLTDKLVSLQGSNNVIGRAVVIHRDEDDLGLGGVPASLTTGNAGARIACCVIDSCVFAV